MKNSNNNLIKTRAYPAGAHGSARHLPDFKATSCKSIQPISFAKWQEYSRFAAAKSVAGTGTPKPLSTEKTCFFSGPTCTLSLVA